MGARAHAQVAAMGTRDGAAHRQPHARARTPLDRGAAGHGLGTAVEHLEDAFAPGRRDPRRSRTASSSWSPCRAASISTGASGGVYLSALSTRFSSICDSSIASHHTSGKPGSRRARTRRAGSRRRTRASTAPTISSADSQSRRSSKPVASRRASCSVLSASRDSRVASSTMLSASRRRASGARRSSWSRSEEAAPTMVASGVRKSCEMAASSAFRTPSACAASRARCSSPAACARSSASPSGSHRACRCRRSSSSAARASAGGRSTAAPKAFSRPRSGRYQSGWSSWRPLPGPSAWRCCRQWRRPARCSASTLPESTPSSSGLSAIHTAAGTPATVPSIAARAGPCATGSRASRSVSPQARRRASRSATRRAASASRRRSAMSALTMPLTTSIASSSSACWRRSTAMLWRGGTKVQLKATTEAAPAAAESQPGSHIEATAETRTSSMARLARSRRPSSSRSAQAPAAQTNSAGQRERTVETGMAGHLNRGGVRTAYGEGRDFRPRASTPP